MGRSPESHYPTAATDEILKIDVPGITAEDAICFLWGLPYMSAEALDLLRGWGFAVKTNLVWVKPTIGLGYLMRNRHELLWIGTMGNPPAPARGEQPDSVIEAPRGEHSEKPRAVHEMIERLYPTLPKIELFARGAARPGRLHLVPPRAPMTRAPRRRGKEGRRAVSGPASPVWPASEAAAVWLLYTRTAHRGCRDPWAECRRKSAIWASAGLGIVEPSKDEARR